MRRQLPLAVLLLLASGSAAHAFCGFYVSGADGKLFNNATQVVLMREGTRTVLSMQNAYQGPPEAFAMVVPVPVVLHEKDVKTLPREVFDRVDRLAAPRLVEYWEQDPCPEPVAYEGGRGDFAMRPAGAPSPARTAAAKDMGVKIEAQFTVGEYEIVILSAKDSQGLDTWLRHEKYKIPEGAEPYLRPYVAAGSKFFVAKVDPQKVRFEGDKALLSPLRFHYDSSEFALPVRLGLVNSAGTQDLIVHVLARGQRYEVANYPNVFVPTNLDVGDAAKQRFGDFYAALFDATLEKHPKAVVTEYSWDAGSCDPCPSPALNPGELQTLGADVLDGAQAPQFTPPPPPRAQGGAQKPTPGAAPGAPSRAVPPMRPPQRWGGGFVLTRLHARYGKDVLGEDLVFRAAPPVMGGREMMGPDGKLERVPQPGGVNNFQGRYAVRHPWGGAITCQNPRRGVWGGPPYGVQPQTPVPALKTAFAQRGLALASFLVGGQDTGLGVEGQSPPPEAVKPVGTPPPRHVPGRHTPPPPGPRATRTEELLGGGLLVAIIVIAVLLRRKP